MNLNEYQDMAELYQRPSARSLEYLTLGLMGEAGEVAEKVKRLLRDNQAVDPKEIGKELGDVLWYVARLAAHFELSLDSVAAGNISKLWLRKENGTEAGKGDNR